MISNGASAPKAVAVININSEKDKEGKLQIIYENQERATVPPKYEDDQMTFFEKMAVSNIKRHVGVIDKEIIKKFVHENFKLSDDYINNIPVSVYTLISDGIDKFINIK